MKVLVDIGNNNIKWATIDNNGLSTSHSFPRGKTGIKTALNKAWKTLKDVESVHVANVAGEKPETQLTEWTEKHWQLTPTFVRAESQRFGVSNAYDNAEKLGVDRWLALITARQHARQAQCIIDCGTAITIDIVTQKGQHQGGMILPGLGLMQSSLANNTHALTEEVDEKEFNTLATNTYSAIQAGTLYCISATLERIITDLKDSFNNRIRFIITGGDAEHILPLLPEHVHHYPDIVLKGLAFYARQTAKKAAHRNNTTTETTQQEATDNEAATESQKVTGGEDKTDSLVPADTVTTETATDDKTPAAAKDTSPQTPSSSENTTEQTADASKVDSASAHKEDVTTTTAETKAKPPRPRGRKSKPTTNNTEVTAETTQQEATDNGVSTATENHKVTGGEDKTDSLVPADTVTTETATDDKTPAAAKDTSPQTPSSSENTTEQTADANKVDSASAHKEDVTTITAETKAKPPRPRGRKSKKVENEANDNVATLPEEAL